MTSDEIKKAIEAEPAYGCYQHPMIFPTWEIAYQLAVMNEREKKLNINALELNRFRENHGLASPVRQVSETEVRSGDPEPWTCPTCHCLYFDGPPRSETEVQHCSAAAPPEMAIGNYTCIDRRDQPSPVKISAGADGRYAAQEIAGCGGNQPPSVAPESAQTHQIDQLNGSCAVKDCGNPWEFQFCGIRICREHQMQIEIEIHPPDQHPPAHFRFRTCDGWQSQAKTSQKP